MSEWRARTHAQSERDAWTGGRLDRRTGGSSAYHARWQDPATKRARVSPFDARRAQLARDSRSSSTLSSITGVTSIGLSHFSRFDWRHDTRRDAWTDNYRFREIGAPFSTGCVRYTWRRYHRTTSKTRYVRDILLNDAHVCQSEMSRIRLCYVARLAYFPLRRLISAYLGSARLLFSISFGHGAWGCDDESENSSCIFSFS